ncbi:hypothetical protein [Halotia branconii]|uniref:Uncharacterized protein n=1 Tax=Halotia branconii CENA392 TaxID=1539056 RepID=A0AAJ6NUS2_9CYAN|nr:hypothetical protein [Halotia branconii]WGV26960.1 hypothetical protein QI031_05520 [Halotia branconii CENA392]
MKKPFFAFSRLVVAGIGFGSLLIAQPSLAQLNQVDTFPGSSTTDQNTDPFYSPSGNLNMFDVIHRANFGNFNWNPEQQNQQLNSAAEQFKAEQNRRLQNQQQQEGQVVPSLPAVTLPQATPQPQN